MRPLSSAFAAGLLLGVGLAVSQMVNPAKVIGFLDVAGAWDPSLLFVLGGAVVAATIGFGLAPGSLALFVAAMLAGMGVFSLSESLLMQRHPPRSA